jgi:hypothetical protein
MEKTISTISERKRNINLSSSYVIHFSLYYDMKIVHTRVVRNIEKGIVSFDMFKQKTEYETVNHIINCKCTRLQFVNKQFAWLRSSIYPLN